MQGDTSFTNLLNEGSYLDNESIGSSNLNVQIYEPQVEIESSVKKPLGGNFSIEEDILLVEAWINTTTNPMQGNEQTRKTYWMRICENYHANKTFDTRRIQTSLTNRWSTIQKSVNNFCGCLAEIESVDQSRLIQQDKIAQAKELYWELNKTPFSFEHCWNVLKTCPKWNSDKEKVRKRSFATASSTSTLTPINIGEYNISTSNFVDLESPLGRKAAKQRLNKHDIILGLLIEMNERANIMAERKLQLMERRNAQEEERFRVEQSEVRQDEERIRVEQSKVRLEERKVQVENDKIMLMDTSGLSEVQRKYIRIRQMEILESRRRK